MRSWCVVVCGLFLARLSYAQEPKLTAMPSNMSTVSNISSSANINELDRKLLETLKDVHNRGAELYNRGDHAMAFRMYQGGLIVAKAFFEYRPKLQAVVEEGLKQVDESQADAKLKAYRLHEVIDQVRSELKSELKAALSPPSTPLPAVSPMAAVSGQVTLHSKPGSKLSVQFVPAGTTQVAANTTVAEDGSYQIPTPLTLGKYHVVVNGQGVPEAFSKPQTTPLQIDLIKGVNTVPITVK
jgi:hypothetical protein